MPKLRILIKNSPPGVTVARDGRELAAAALGEALPVDPGNHEIVASAGGYRVERRTVTVAEGTTAEIEISLLAQPGSAVATTTAEPKPVVAMRAVTAKSGIPTWAWVSGAAGIALGVASIGFAVDAAAAKGTIHDSCPPNASGTPVCPSGQFTQADVDSLNGRKNRDFPAAWALGVAGIVGLGAAVVGVVTGRKGSVAPVAWVVLGSGGAGVRGTF